MVVQYEPTTKTWGSSWSIDPTTGIDTVLSLTTDGTSLYAALNEGFHPTEATGKTALLKFGLPISTASAPTRVAMPRLSTAWDVELDGVGGFLAVGRSATDAANGRFIRCALTSCPP